MASRTSDNDQPAYLRRLPEQTLKSVAETLSTGDVKTIDVVTNDLKVKLSSGKATINIGKTEIEADPRSVIAIGDFCNIPTPYLKRCLKQDPELAEISISRILTKTGESSASVTLRDGQIESIGEAGKRRIKPLEIVTATANSLDWDAELTRLVNEPHEFAFDAIVPKGFDRGIGGDKTITLTQPEVDGTPARKQVGDITRGGVRVALDIKHGLAPSVQPYFFRLWCTNGAETQDQGLRIDARGATVEDVLAEFEQLAERAFSRVEEGIKHYYDLRTIKVDNPERTIRRIASEGGLPDRSMVHLMHLAPSSALPDSPTMFDVMNLVTNLANSPALRRDGGRVLLERVGGSVVADHAARCKHCTHATLR